MQVLVVLVVRVFHSNRVSFIQFVVPHLKYFIPSDIADTSTRSWNISIIV